MSVENTAGVRALARILQRLSQDRELDVADVVAEDGVSRSTAFDVVRRLKAAGFAAPAPGGKVRAGGRLVALGYSRFGLAALQGPGEAVARWLRDHSDATVRLSCAQGPERVTLALFPAAGRLAGASEALAFSLPICRADGAEAARLEVQCLRASSRAAAAEIEHLAHRAKLTLERYLTDEAAGAGDGTRE